MGVVVISLTSTRPCTVPGQDSTMATQSPSSLAAVVIGATGATGKCLVQTLLAAKVTKIC